MNLRTTPEAVDHFDDEKNVALFTSLGIYTPEEIRSRKEICMEEYGKTILIEARATLDILRKQITPACMAYSRQVADGVAVKRSIGIEAGVEAGLVRTITEKTALLIQSQDALSAAVAAAPVEAAECAHY